MLRSVKELIGYQLVAGDDHLGKVKDCLFDDRHWAIRWLVVDTGSWLSSRKVLVSPISLGTPDWEAHVFPVKMTKKQIEEAPELDYDAPVSREYETKWFKNFGSPYYWMEPGAVWGGAYPGAFLPMWGSTQYPVEVPSEINEVGGEECCPEAGSDVVRSTQVVKGYKIQAVDGEIGQVEDFILDDGPWTLRYMVVNTGNWLPGKSVLVSPTWVNQIEWAQEHVFVDLQKEAIKASPEFDPSKPVNRKYEEQLHDYYGRPAYWRK